MSNVIIGIHGLANKPEASILAKGWKDSICEGIKKNEGIDNFEIDFASVYWADVLYNAADKKPDLYKPASAGELKTYNESWLDSVREEVFDWGGSVLDSMKSYLGTNEFADRFLEYKFKDLSRYYHEESIRNILRQRLEDEILKHKEKRIMLISHSMGTIIAYDVLRKIGKAYPRLVIDHFITLGSPLGLPHVRYKIAKENPRVRTPSVVSKWSNFADRRDPVSLDVSLSGDYGSNNKGVKVVDDLVANDWASPHHKAYGYLRTPEVSKAIRDFI